MKPASHPPSCSHCDGSGWQDGPPIPGVCEGRPFDYHTVEPCSHEWWRDDPLDAELIDYDEYTRRRP